MGTRGTQAGTSKRWAAVVAACAVAACLAGPSFAQDAPPPAKPGIFESIGRWFDKGASDFRDHLRGAKRRMDEVGDEAAANSRGLGDKAAEAGKNAAEATRGAVDAVTKLPTARVMQGRERCVIAPNGAPDCLSAAEALCKKHGYATGKSIDFTSAEDCPARSYIGGGTPGAECTTVTFINRAMCQ